MTRCSTVLTAMFSLAPAAAVATLALAVPVYAQSSGSSFSTGVMAAVQAGGVKTVTEFNDAGTADLKLGFSVGGELGYQFHPVVTLRGTYSFKRSEARGTGLPSSLPAGTKTNRQFYGGELQLNAPLPGGFSPYLLAGAGAVTFKPDTTPSQDSFTKPAGKAGVGLGYTLPNSPASIFVEGNGWVYKLDRFGFDKTQFDLTWSGGLAYRFGK